MKKTQNIFLGAALIILTILALLVEPNPDATFIFITIPMAIACFLAK